MFITDLFTFFEGKVVHLKQINKLNNKKYGLAVIYGIQLFIEREYLAFFVIREFLFWIIKHYEVKKKDKSWVSIILKQSEN